MLDIYVDEHVKAMAAAARKLLAAARVPELRVGAKGAIELAEAVNEFLRPLLGLQEAGKAGVDGGGSSSSCC